MVKIDELFTFPIIMIDGEKEEERDMSVTQQLQRRPSLEEPAFSFVTFVASCEPAP